MKKLLIQRYLLGVGFMLAFALLAVGLHFLGVFSFGPIGAGIGLTMSFAAAGQVMNYDDELIELRSQVTDEAGKMKARLDVCREEKRSITEDDEYKAAKARMVELRGEIEALEELRAAQLLSAGKKHKKEEETRQQESQEEVRAAFATYLKDGIGALSEEQRAAITYTDTKGAAVPDLFRNRVLTALLENNPFMSKVTLENTDNGNNINIPTINTRDVNGKIVARGNNAGEGEVPVFDNVQLGAYNYSTGKVSIDSDLLDDAGYDIEGKLIQMFPQAILRKFLADAINGDGINKPVGLINVELGCTSQNVGGITGDDIIELEGKVSAERRAEPGVCYVMNDNTRTKIRQLKDNQGQYLYQKSLRDGSPETLNGYPIVIVPTMPNIATGKSPIVFGDLGSYCVRRVKKMTLHRQANIENNQMQYNLFMRLDGKPINLGDHPLKRLVIQ